ncbi:hypothetical protein KCP73_00150 [Salmonella enterica subsp. enterica]|nr:hypothetical protein KCP73_00150 [Salmonella enterica subsp. enterica]
MTSKSLASCRRPFHHAKPSISCEVVITEFAPRSRTESPYRYPPSRAVAICPSTNFGHGFHVITAPVSPVASTGEVGHRRQKRRELNHVNHISSRLLAGFMDVSDHFYAKCLLGEFWKISSHWPDQPHGKVNRRVGFIKEALNAAGATSFPQVTFT